MVIVYPSSTRDTHGNSQASSQSGVIHLNATDSEKIQHSSKLTLNHPEHMKEMQLPSEYISQSDFDNFDGKHMCLSEYNFESALTCMLNTFDSELKPDHPLTIEHKDYNEFARIPRCTNSADSERHKVPKEKEISRARTKTKIVDPKDSHRSESFHSLGNNKSRVHDKSYTADTWTNSKVNYYFYGTVEPAISRPLSFSV